MTARLYIMLAVVTADPEWKRESAPEGITLESRPVTDSAFYEYRAQADSDVPAPVLCDAVYEWGSKSRDHENLKARTIVEDRGDTRLVYDQLDPPVVACRDFGLSVTRTHNGDGSCEIEFHISNERVPKSPDGWVRLTNLRGSWRFESAAANKTHVTYRIWAEPGGSIPPVFVHGSQRAQAIAAIQNAMSRSRQPPKQKSAAADPM